MNENAGQQPDPRVQWMIGSIRKEIDGSARPGWNRAGSSCGRCITFRDYMSLCLYHPEFGYYRSGAARVGREGDFYTSAYVGDVMGEQLAERLARLASEHFPGGGTVHAVDWGGGTGRLGRQMADTWRRMGPAGERFSLTVVDGNPEHRRLAAAALADEMVDGRARVVGTEEAETENWRARQTIVVANELLDAFPVHRVIRVGVRLLEWAVAWDDAGHRLAPCLTELSDPALSEWLARQGVRLEEGQTTEIGLEGADWIAGMAALLGDAILVVIDYGDVTAELTGPHRMNGTLLGYRNHRAFDDPFLTPGSQDLTAHVDFDLIRCNASAAGWRELWYGTQKRFLMESGVLSKLAGHGIADPFHPVVRRNRAIRQLLLSDGMSELFKVQILIK